MTTVPFTSEAVSRGGGICSDAAKRAFDPLATAGRATGVRAIPNPAAVGAINRTLVCRAIKATAEHLGTTVPYFIPDCQSSRCADTGRLRCASPCEMTGRSLGLIENNIGDRHHATIWHGVRAIRRLLDAEMAAAVEAIMERLGVTAGVLWRTVHRSNRRR